MFKKLKSRREFLRVQNYGLKAVTKRLILQSLDKKENQNIKRFGFTASRKIGNSVIRNRAKRRLRALVQINFKEQFNIGMDYVLIARNETANREFQKLNKDLLWALNNFS